MFLAYRLVATAAAVVVGSGAIAVRAQPPTPPMLGAGFDTSGSGCLGDATSALSAFRPLPSRSPSGLLYRRPPALPAPQAGPGGSFSGCAEFGALLGENDEPSALFRAYRDLDGRALLHLFSFSGEAADGRFVDLAGGNIGRGDQYYGLRAGRHNAWSITAYYNETPHVIADRYRSLWSGVGSAELTLAQLRPGGLANATETQTALREAIARAPASTLQITREKGGLSMNARLGESWRTFLSIGSERRQGARPFGAVFGGGDGGGNIEIPQPVDDASHDISAGASFTDALTSLNLTLSASLYRNRIGTLSFDNPLTVTPNGIDGIGAAAFTRGRFALDPDNDATHARLDFARAFPHWFNARVTAVAAFGRMRQNEPLLAPTSLTLAGATLNGVAAEGRWNTTAALTRDRADARIDTRLAVLTASLQPAAGLSLLARFRSDSTDNSTAYLACNPVTGQLGRLLNDGSGAALVNVPQYLAARCDLAAIRALGITPDAGDIILRSAPYEQRSETYGLTADWQLRRSTRLSGEWERREIRWLQRERDRTWEDRLKFTVAERGLAGAHLRASIEYAERGGSALRGGLQDDRLSSSLGPLPTIGNVSTWFASVDQLRRFDLADRKQTTLQARADFALGEGFDLGLRVTGRQARYPRSFIGRGGRQESASASIDASYVAASGLALHGYYTIQGGRMHQVGVQPAGCLIGFDGVTAENFRQCGAFGGPLFPGDRAWEATSRDRNHVAGAGGQAVVPWGVVDFDYTYTRTRTTIDTLRGAGIVLSPARAALADAGWPDLRFRQHVLAAGTLLPLTKRAALRLRLQYESGRVDDWHDAGVAENPVPLADSVYLNDGPQRYRAVFGSVLLRLRL